MKVLVCIVNHGENQIWCLEQLLKEYKSWKYDVDIIIHSNISLPLENNKTSPLYDGVKVQTYNNLENPHYLPFQTRKTIFDLKNDYDLFIYSENDHLITQRNIDAFLKVTSFLPNDKICGFFQYELYDCGKVYPGAHAHFSWDFQTIFQVKEHSNYVFASYSNPHQASYVLTKNQLNKVIKEIDFLTLDLRSGFTPKCTVNTDIYLKPKWDKVLCISHWEDFLIQHLPNRYLKVLCTHQKDFDPVVIEMCRQVHRIKSPFKYDENGNQTEPYSMNLNQYFGK